MQRFGANPDVVVALLITGLLGWVGLTTYNTAMTVQGLQIRFEIFAQTERKENEEFLGALSRHEKHEVEDRFRMAADRLRIEERIDELIPRLRNIEEEHRTLGADRGVSE